MRPRPNPYDLTTHDGKKVDWLTKAALLKAEKKLGYELSITQGSYNPGKVVKSAGTHDRGGVVDLLPWDWRNKVKVLRQCGFVAYRRLPAEGDWPEHIHAVLLDHKRLAPAAAAQLRDYHLGRNGLANHGPDPHPGMLVTGFVWPYYGPVGLARWKRDQLRGKEREAFLKRLAKVVQGQ